MEQIFKRSFTRQKVRHGDLGMSGIFFANTWITSGYRNYFNGRVNVHVEARKPLLLTWSVTQDRVRPIFRQSTTFIDEFWKWLTVREIFPRNSVMFETSRDLRKLPSLLAKFVDKAADSMTALEAPNTRKDETVPGQVTNANTAGIKLKTIKNYSSLFCLDLIWV